MRTVLIQGAASVASPEIEIQLNAQQLAVAARIHNLTPNLYRIRSGSRMFWLPALRVDRFPLKDDISIFAQVIQLEVPGLNENNLLIDVAYLNDAPDMESAFPGNYPNDINRLQNSFGKAVAARALPIIGTNNGQNPSLGMWSGGLNTGALGAGGTKLIATFGPSSGGSSQARLIALVWYPFSVSAATAITFSLVHFNGTALPTGGSAMTTAWLNQNNRGDFLLSTQVQGTLLPTTGGTTEDTNACMKWGAYPFGIIAGSVSDLYRQGIQLWPPMSAPLDIGGVDGPVVNAVSPFPGPLVPDGYNLYMTVSAAATVNGSLYALWRTSSTNDNPSGLNG